MERLHALTPLYLEGLVAYDAIGARNVTDQTAREYASGTSSPVGLKNAPDGSIDDAISAVVATRESHTFLGMRKDGMPSRIKTAGNKLAHIILRGGKNGPNYLPTDIAGTKEKLAAKSDAIGEELPRAIVVDASHGNSGKKAANQRLVVESLAEQVATGEEAIKGVMLESNLVAGKQDLRDNGSLEYGKSVTDECIDVDETDVLLNTLAQSVTSRRTLSAIS
jgi:3-deoxy-7-phosphoheptulonate synthase